MDRLDLAGVPVFFEEGPEPAMASLLFRAGIADEPAWQRGVTHLVEHLAFHSLGRRDHDMNGFVELFTTTLWARGTMEELERFLEDISRALAAPRLERLEDEKRVLQTEASRTASGIVPRMLSYRFGTRGPGMADVIELGLRRLTPEEVESWAHERFGTAAVAMWVHGPRPPQAELALTRGTRPPLPPAEPLSGIEFPAWIASGTGGVAVSMVSERSWAATVGLGVARELLHERLRLKEGVTYDVWGDYMPLGPDSAHVAVGADCLDENAASVSRTILEALDDLAEANVDEEELERAKRTVERVRTDDPERVKRDLDRMAYGELLGEEMEPVDQLMAELLALTVDDVSRLWSRSADTALLVAPDDTPKPRDSLAELERPPGPVDGRPFKSKGRGGFDTLVMGPEGVAVKDPAGETSIPADEIVVLIGDPDGILTVIGVDGRWIELQPQQLEDTEEALAILHELSPGPVVPSDDMRAQWVEVLAQEKLTRRWTVKDELAALPDVLDPGEEPITMAEASRGMRVGLLVVTGRRVLYFGGGIGGPELLRFDRSDISGPDAKRRPFGSARVRFTVDGERFDFTDIRPKSGADEIVAALLEA